MSDEFTSLDFVSELANTLEKKETGETEEAKVRGTFPQIGVLESHESTNDALLKKQSSSYVNEPDCTIENRPHNNQMKIK